MASGTIPIKPYSADIDINLLTPASSTTNKFNVPDNYRGFIVSMALNSTYQDIIFVSSSAGTVTAKSVTNASGLTITTGTNLLTLTHSAATLRFLVIGMNNMRLTLQ